MSVSLIAEKAGVSIATVSRVLNKSRPVNPEMAELVHKAMEELQLPPRQIRRRSRSRSKASDRHTTVAIVSLGQAYQEWFEVPVIANVVAELTRAAQELHIGVLMTEMPDPRELSPLLRRPEVEGALAFVDSELSTRDVAVLRDHLPVVRVMGGQLAPVDIDHVGTDNTAVGYIAAEYLLEQGVESLAFLTMRPDWDLNKLRAQGFMATADAAGIQPTMYLQGDPQHMFGFFGPGAVVESDLTALLRRLKSERKGRMGLFVSRDEETVYVYRILREVGLEPGRDVVIVSCDNESVRLSTLHPRPASIDLSAAQIARHAVRRLSARIKNRDEPPARILVNPRLVQPDERPAGIGSST